jgi:uncharacterized protein YegL
VNQVGNCAQNNQKAKKDQETVKDFKPWIFLGEKQITAKRGDDEQVYQGNNRSHIYGI